MAFHKFEGVVRWRRGSFYPKHRMGRNTENSFAVIHAGSTTPTGTKSREWVRLARVIGRAVTSLQLIEPIHTALRGIGRGLRLPPQARGMRGGRGIALEATTDTGLRIEGGHRITEQGRNGPIRNKNQSGKVEQSCAA